MQMIVSKTKLIMLIAGLITCTTSYAMFFPQAALTSMFGAALSDSALAQIIVRSWGALVTLVGGLLLYGAFKPQDRPLILTIAALSKLIFVALLLLFGGPYFPQIATPIFVDSLAIILLAICLPNAIREIAIPKSTA